MKKSIIVSLLVFFSCLVTGEDIEVFVGNGGVQDNFPPQVLIIFDNSGSMNGLLTDVRVPYDPNRNYPAIGSDTSTRGTFTYYVTGGIGNDSLPVPTASEARRFQAQVNSCNTAVTALRQFGFYTGYLREYQFAGNSGTWEEFPSDNGSEIDVVDCLDDILLNDPSNQSIRQSNNSVINLPDGFPVNNRGNKNAPQYYTNSAADSNVDWSGRIVTLYTDNYLRWAHQTNPETRDSTKLQEAKGAITTLLGTTRFADFGLQIFNVNAFNENQRDGGRVVFGIKESTDANRRDLINLVNNQIDGETNTPLCETMYEASRYLSGQSVLYGDDDSIIFGRNFTYIPNTPPRDTSIENNGLYTSPYRCNDTIHIILITDGSPTVDNAADDEVRALPGISAPFTFSNGRQNYLPALAKWMNTNDLNTSIDGDQVAVVHTIGFGDGFDDETVQLLRQTAQNGKGTFIQVDAAQSDLTAALVGTLAQIGDQNGTLTSASVASNNFDRTQTLDFVYYAMFQPNNSPRWQGNLKKYRIVNQKQLGVNNVLALDGNGNFSNDVRSFWSSTVDGNDPSAGGVAEMLRTKTNRKIITNFSTNLPELTLESAKTFYSTKANLAAALGGVDEGEIDNSLNWAFGIDVDDDDQDGSRTDIRLDVFADPLHSQPLVINYGGSSESNQDIRIIVGTNAGALHMFEDKGDSVDETWAFMPKEFFKNIKGLRENFAVTPKIYGIDGAITPYINDVNGNGIIEAGSGDQVWIFFGARRGGHIYYGLDISSPSNPKLLWQIDPNSAGFANLGQSWSAPQIGFSKLNVSGTNALPVLFIAGGYDTNKDNGGVGTDDSSGVGAYMLDAKTGTLLWQLSSADSSATNTKFAGKDSIPGDVTTLDSDTDGFIDRLYLADTGGHLWRVDMPGATPNSTENPWQAVELASLGSRTDITQDRRFFYAPTVTQTFITDTVRVIHTDASGQQVETITRQETPYDAILLSSGDRTRPLSRLTQDRLYMIKDENILTQSFGREGNASIPSVITNSNLSDFTSNPFSGNLTAQQRQTLELATSQTDGWFVNLTTTGEKGVSSAIVINGNAFFSSFAPPAQTQIDLTNCRLIINGGNAIYGIALALGTEVLNFTNASDGDKRKLTTDIPGILNEPTFTLTRPKGNDQNGIPQNPTISLIGRSFGVDGTKRVPGNLATERHSLVIQEQQQ